MFDDAYYQKAQQDYMNYYQPELDRQYDKAQKNLVSSRSGATTFGDFADERSRQEAQIGNQAIGFGNDLRSNIESARNELYAQNSSAANPGAAAQSAIQRAKLLTAPPQYSPLGDVFSQFINQASTRVGADKNREIENITPIQFTNTGGGSMRVIG